MSSVVSVKRSPGESWIGPGSIFPIRIFGPGRSAMMATRRPVAVAAARIREMLAAWLAKSPWEKFSRATFSPARISRSNISGESEAGPMVAMILVLWRGRIMKMAKGMHRAVGQGDLVFGEGASRAPVDSWRSGVRDAPFPSVTECFAYRLSDLWARPTRFFPVGVPAAEAEDFADALLFQPAEMLAGGL